METSLHEGKKKQEASHGAEGLNPAEVYTDKDYRMKERMQKMSTESDSCPQQSRPEAKGTVGVQTFMRVVDGCLTTTARLRCRKAEEPPYAEPLVRWCERTSEHEKR